MFHSCFRGSDFAHDGGHRAKWAGPVSANVLYRFVTLDGKAAVVRDDALGWAS